MSGQKHIILDFSHTKKMHADATLLFIAELRTLVRQREGAIEWTLLPSHTNKVMQVLKQVKLLELIGFKNDIECKDDDVVRWLTAFGQGADGSKFDDVMGPYQGEIAEALSAKLYSGVTEAMTNVVNHAYTVPREDGLISASARDWWMFSAQHDNGLTVVICDLGGGIPGTLPYSKDHKGLWKKIRRLKQVDDGKIIAYAVTESVSRTKKSHRGRGLGQIAHVIQQIESARVTILSNYGAYQRNSAGKVKIWNHTQSILGTLIFWEIPLMQGVST